MLKDSNAERYSERVTDIIKEMKASASCCPNSDRHAVVQHSLLFSSKIDLHKT